MEKETKQKEKKTENQPQEGAKMRKLYIETDGNNVRLVANETSGLLEFKAILTELLTRFR